MTRGLPPPGLRVRRCAFRGAAALLAVLLLAGLAGVGLAAWHAAAERERDAAVDREAGRVFGRWFLALHEAAQQGLVPATVWSTGQAVTVTPAQIEAWGTAPVGLRRNAGRDTSMTLGLMDDGAGVAMAFAVLEPGVGGTESMRRGAVQAGLVDAAESGGTASAISDRAPSIASAMGVASLADGTLFATADWAVARRDDQLWRRAQPGRPELSRMQADLSLTDANGNVHGLTDAGIIEGADAEVATKATVAGDAAVTGDVEAKEDLDAKDALSAGAGLQAESLTIAGAASAGSAAISGKAEAASASVTGGMRSGTLDAPTLSAGSLSAGSSWIVGDTGAVSGAMSVGSCSGCDF